ncbi:MFS transporter, partial [candidate division KSB1 bacterium]|nr:MFS transporter [candidate division KSB1 bacterium]
GIMGALLIVGIISDAFRPANCTAMAEVCPPDRRARGFALNRLAVNLGIAIGPAIGGFLATVNYGYLFWIDGLTCILAGLLLIFIVRRLHVVKAGSNSDNVVRGLSPWKDGPFLTVMGLLLAVGIVFFQLFNSWSIFVKEFYHLNEDGIGLLIAINATLIVLIEMPLIHRLERKNTLQLMAIGSILIAGGFSLVMFGRSFGYISMTVVLWTMGEMLLFPIIGAYTANRAPDVSRGKYIGLFTLTFSAAMIFAPILGTWVYENKGPYVLWTAVGIIGLLVFGGFQILDALLGRKCSGKRDALESV